MGLFDDWKKNIAPISLPIAGAAVGGPAGAMVGMNAAAMLQDKKVNDEFAQNAALQREFAQHGIRWKVEDAKAAGIHPLAALGASTHSFSPISVGGADTSQFDNLSSMGQNLSRVLMSTSTEDERTLSKLQLANAQADLDGKIIDNQIRSSQLHTMTQTGPSMPIKIKPSEQTATATGLPHQQAGQISDVGWVKTKSGYAPVPSVDVKERIEDQMIPEAMWSYRNQLIPNLQSFGAKADKPPRSLLPGPNYEWEWSYTKQEWQPYKRHGELKRGGWNGF